MNGLSWFLYFADIVSNVQGLLGGLGLFSAMIVGLISLHEVLENDNTRPLKYLYIPIVCVFLAVAIPSKETIYLIAGSEAGEAVVTSTEGRQIISDIKDVISHQLDNLKKGD